MGNTPTCMDCPETVPTTIRLCKVISLDQLGVKIYKAVTGKKWLSVGDGQYICYKCFVKRQNTEKESMKQEEMNIKNRKTRQQSKSNTKNEHREKQRKKSTQQQHNRTKNHSKNVKANFQENVQEWKRNFQKGNQYEYSEHLNQNYATKGNFLDLSFPGHSKEVMNNDSFESSDDDHYSSQRVSCNADNDESEKTHRSRDISKSRSHIALPRISKQNDSKQNASRRQEDKPSVTHKSNKQNAEYEEYSRIPRTSLSNKKYEKKYDRCKNKDNDFRLPSIHQNQNSSDTDHLKEKKERRRHLDRKKVYSHNRDDACRSTKHQLQESSEEVYSDISDSDGESSNPYSSNNVCRSTNTRIKKTDESMETDVSQSDRESIHSHTSNDESTKKQIKYKGKSVKTDTKRRKGSHSKKESCSHSSNDTRRSTKDRVKDSHEKVGSDICQSDRKSSHSHAINDICSKCAHTLSHLGLQTGRTYWNTLEMKLLQQCISICSPNNQSGEAHEKSMLFLKSMEPFLKNTCCDHIAMLKVCIFVYFIMTKESNFPHIQNDPSFQKFKCSHENFPIEKHPNLAMLTMVLCNAAFHISDTTHRHFLKVSEKLLSLCFEECKIPKNFMNTIQKELQWNVLNILTLLSQTQAFIKKTSFLRACHFIQSCKFTPKSKIDGKNVIEVLRKNSSQDIRRLWKNVIRLENRKNIHMILEEIEKNNSGECKDYLQREFQFIKDVVSSVRSRMRDLSKPDAENVIEAKKRSDDIVDCLCTLSAAVFITHRYWPNSAQLASLCFFIQTHKKGSGLLLEIKTGEGKSCVISMFAAYLAIYGKCDWIDVISSSVILAQRDSLEWTSFYQRLGITVGCNIFSNVSEKRQRCYKNRVVYGTVGTFASDMLRQEFQMENVRGSRQCSVVLVDEVDCMLLDNGIQFTYLSHSVPGMHHLDPILLMIWNEVVRHDVMETSDGKKVIIGRIQPIHEYLATIPNMTKSLNPMDILEDIEKEGVIKSGLTEKVKREERKYGGRAYIDQQSFFRMFLGKTAVLKILLFYKSQRKIPFQPYEKDENGVLKIHPVGLDNEKDKINVMILEGGYVRSIDFNHEKIHSLLAMKMKKCLEKEKSAIGYEMPRHLNEFIHDRMVHWIGNAFIAKQMKNEREYIISDNQIIPVDFESTGVVEFDTKWGDGLHQFLEIKHFMRLTPLGIVTNFMSNRAYFKRYGETIYGVSGTIGTANERHYLEKTFGLECCSIPTSKRQKFLELPGIVCFNTTEWYHKIVETIKYESQKQDFRNERAVLVICEDINTAQCIVLKLRKEARLQSVTLYARNDRENDKIDNTIEGGDVIVATNIAGRGTDLNIDKAVLESGGLFVLVTFLPQNTRVENQIFGRTARKGEPGSAIIIIDISKQPLAYRSCKNMEQIKAKRDKAQALKLSNIERFRTTDVDNKETLFRCYCEFLRDDFPKFKDETEMKIATDTMHEFWGFWLKRNSTRKFSSSLEEKLEKDLMRARDKLSQQKSPYGNVSHIIKLGNAKMKSKRYEDAESLYTRAIRTDSKWAAIAYYNRAYCTILKKDDSSLEKALQDLKEAKKCFEIFKHETLLCLALLGVIPRDSQSECETILTQFETRCQILHFLYTNVSIGINKIYQLKKEDQTPVIEAMSSFTIIVGNDAWSKKIDSEIYLYWQIGLTEIIKLSERARFSWKGVLVAALGVMQVALGILVAVTTSGIIINAGVGIIFEGVRDICTGVKAVLQSDNDFIADWMVKKVSRTVASIVFIGCNQLRILDAVTKALPIKMPDGNALLPFGNGLETSERIKVLAGELARKMLSVGKEFLIDIANCNLKKRFRKSCYSEIEARVSGILRSDSFCKTLDKFIINLLRKNEDETDIVKYVIEITQTLLSETQVKQLGPDLCGCVKQVLIKVKDGLRDSNGDEDTESLTIIELFDSCEYESVEIRQLVKMYAKQVIQALENLIRKQDFSETEKEDKDKFRNSVHTVKKELKAYISKQLWELMERSFEQMGSSLQATKASRIIHEVVDSSAPQMDFGIPSFIRNFWNENPLV